MDHVGDSKSHLVELSEREFLEIKSFIIMSDKQCTEFVSDYYKNDEAKRKVDICRKWCKRLHIESETDKSLTKKKKKIAERKKSLKAVA